MINHQLLTKFYNSLLHKSLENMSRICQFVFLSLFIIFLFSSCKKTNIDEVSGPVITGISPSKGIPGTVVILTGNYFGEGVSQNKVSFDGQEAVINSASKTQLIVITPAHLPGMAAVKVTVNGKESKAVNFEYLIAGANNSFFPENGKTYHYHVTSPTGNFDFYNQLLEQKDSAGLYVVKIGSFLPSSTVVQYAFRSSTETIYRLDIMQETVDMYNALAATPGYVSGVLEGFPIEQHMSNAPLVNEAINFIGGPMHMRTVFESNTPGIPFIVNDFKQYYQNGKVLSYETVTTAAGTFTNCLKWEYDTKTITETTGVGVAEQNFHKTVWFANNIGLVKDIESGPDGNTVSELVSID